MASNQDVLDAIEDCLTTAYEKNTGFTIPKKDDLPFWNTVKVIEDAKVFFIDMRKSRKILSDASDFWSIKIHRAFLKAVVHCLEKREGHLRSFNGDGILAFFVWENAASKAVRAALDIKGFVLKINEMLSKKGKSDIDFWIGIAQWKIMVAKSGKSWDDQTKQDLIWIGLPVYLAVELSEFGKTPNNIWISPSVRTSIGSENHLSVVNDKDGNSIWKKETKKLKSVGDYEVRYTSFNGVI